MLFFINPHVWISIHVTISQSTIIAMRTLKIGLLLDNEFAGKYVYDLAEWAQRQENIEISHLIVQRKRFDSSAISLIDDFRRHGAAHVISWMVFRSIIKIETGILSLTHQKPQFFKLFDLTEKIKQILVLESDVQKQGAATDISSIDAQRVKALGLDLLVSFGCPAQPGNIFSAARLGTLSFNHGNDISLGGPAFFWECYTGKSKTRMTIKRFDNDPATAEVLVYGYFQTKFMYSLNRDNLCRKSVSHFQDLLVKIAAKGELPKGDSNLHCEQPLALPRPHQSLAYAWKVIGRVTKKILFRAVKYRKKWSVSYTTTNWKGVMMWNGSTAKAPKGHFWADPFVHFEQDRTYCFVEDFVYKTGRGRISVLGMTEDGFAPLGACIEEPFHLSFPFLFKYQNNLYMCPECSESKQIRLYRCISFPLSWELAQVLMDGVSAADTVLFEHGGKWWLLTSIDKSGTDDHCSELYVFYAASPLEKNWVPHLNNPVRIDSDGGRNAGLILEDGRIFRLAQRQGYDQYGEGMLAYEITALTESIYREKLVSEMKPHFKKGLLGIHHLSTTGSITVFDYKTHSFL
jgi:hypothetical protein